MSDQDTPPPMDDNDSPDDPGLPPPMGQEGAPQSQSDPAQPTQSGVPDPTTPPPTAGVALGQGKLEEKDERTMGMLAHILGAVTVVIGPLIIWLIKREESPFVDDQGKEALNFQITILIGHVASMILGGLTGGCASVILSPVVWLVSLIFGILGGLEANKGNVYRYPFALRLVS